MAVPWKLVRLAAGLVGLAVVLFATFSLILPALRTWGTTPVEALSALPGDELLASPELVMTHGLTIDASPGEVWPWIAQMGDARGGFYSYTFIENLIAGRRLYRNAARILPELQNPAVGEQLIEGMLSIHSLEQGRWLLGKADPESGMGWTWVWALFPQGQGRTRLLVRYRIEPPEQLGTNPVAGFFLETGSFVMGRKMMEGIALRVEGGREPAFVQIMEIALWLLALAAGLAAAVLYVGRSRWWSPLLTAVAAVPVLIWFTLGQPALWLRLVAAAGLLAALWWVWRCGAGRGARGAA